jgi:hypothetical protein
VEWIDGGFSNFGFPLIAISLGVTLLKEGKRWKEETK